MDKEHHKISIASDHKGYDLKSKLIPYITSLGHKIYDLGPDSDESVDYPDYAHKTAEHLEDESSQLAILICGSGIGMSIAANRHSHIRAALCFDKKMAELARAHNNANILVLGAKVLNEDIAKSMVEKFLTTSFEGGRHLQRLAKIR
jgi:ribose 5-phosphate isomerase B